LSTERCAGIGGALQSMMKAAMKDSLVTVFGGGGFLGRYVTQALLKQGARVRIAERNPKDAWYLKAQANLGQIASVRADVTKPETLARAVSGADAVVNLVGSFDNMDAVQAKGAANVAQAAVSGGAGALIHISAIGANASSPSLYGRSKGEGEAAIFSAFPHATILRPSIVFGREDQFINRFAALIRMLPLVPVIGADVKFQPVFVGDVAHAVAAVLVDPATYAGRTYELGGPQVFSMLELNQWITSRTGREKRFIPVPNAIAAAMASLTGWLPGAPITRDQWLMLQSDNVVGPHAKGLSDLGVEATPLDTVARGWLVEYRKHGRFGATA
jgi:uncharacterized protein YbjT (DUF2867 family)